MEPRRHPLNQILLAAISSIVYAASVSASGPDRAHDGHAVISPAKETAAGLGLREDFLAGAEIADDPGLVATVRRVGRRVVAQSERPDLPFAFYVIEGHDPPEDYQAISLPGGTIALTRGLAELLASDEDRLAFALAHEVAHVSLRHHLSAAELLHPGSSAAAGFSDRLRRYRELEADRYGALYLVRAGFRFSAASEALSRVAAATGEWDRDARRHPRYDVRLDNLEKFRPELERSVDAFDRAAELLEADRVDDALEALAIFVQQFPYSVAGRVNLGAACLAKLSLEQGGPGGLAEALPVERNAGVVVRGLFDGELLERARHNFRQALAVQSSNSEALLGLALVELREGRAQGSERYLSRVAEPENLRVLLARGNASYLEGEPDRAAGFYLRALALRENWPAARKNLALACEAAGRHVRAAEIWRSLAGDPQFGDQARWQLTLLSSEVPKQGGAP